LAVDPAKLEALIRQWREMSRSNVGLARQILRELLAGERVVLTPRRRSNATTSWPPERWIDFPRG